MSCVILVALIIFGLWCSLKVASDEDDMYERMDVSEATEIVEEEITDEREKPLKAYNEIKEYCESRSRCEGCFFEMSEPYDGMCLLEDAGTPKHWEELEI